MSGTSAYAFDSASEHAGGRFDALQTCYDPVTFARLADLGVTPGMRCLDVAYDPYGAVRRLAALDRMVRALRPGGRLVLDEFDCAWVPVLSAPSPGAATLFETVHDALIDLLTRAGADPRWGLRTYGALRAAGLTDVASATWAGAWPGGGAGVRLHAVNVRQVRDRLVAECGVPDADIDEFLRLLDDPAFAVNSYPLISTWGTRP
ncbi:methyltransferase [Streptomyces sp. NPDC002680]|uniref:methyltransferase n=1 Tax=Streptomyces sp. NPDC002680 TaxID=3364659 RepID=UPI00368368BA